MDWPQFWTSFFASSGAAVVALASAVGVFFLSRLAERRDNAQRERRARIGRIQAAAHNDLLLSAVTWSGLYIGRGAAKLLEAVHAFAAAEWAEHEAVARWAMEKVSSSTNALKGAERWWLLPGHTKRRQAVVAPGSEIAAALALWETGAIKDSWFEERLSVIGKKELADSRSALRARRLRWSSRLGRAARK
ncbi:hypothetical protein [Cellulomonas sp. C5510]|uniref:hypothetical protein n=1 Tax=Cellulomonas sp. C5510 TaxID=2871170 RepID=UPI001C96B0D6|nr:hypothetical protein [Cellulomonas sp. C5510]QZN86925.1 hypothetical protein K5O09_07385 [Cellulomonas sp. C5510]